MSPSAGPGERRGRLGGAAALLSAVGAAVLVTGALAAGALPVRPAAPDEATAARSVAVAASGAALVCPGAPVPVTTGGSGGAQARATTTTSATTGLLGAGAGASLTATALVERPGGQDAVPSASPSAGSPSTTAPAALTGEALGDLLRVRPPGAATATGTGTALTADPVDGRAPLLAGATSSAAASGDLRGLAAPACVVPAEQSWLVGGSTGVGRSTRLVLADASQTATTVDVTVLTVDGPQQPSALQGLSLGPGEQRSVLLEGVLDAVSSASSSSGSAGVGAPLAVQVRSSAGPVAAWMVEGVLQGLVPGGTEVVGPAAAPATSLLVPGVVTAGTGAAVLRVANPGAEPVVARFAVVGASGSSVPAGATPATAVPAGSVVDVELPGLPAGGVALSVEADGPVLAAVRTDSAPAPVDGDPQPGDLAWVPAAEALTGPALVALPPAPSTSSSSSSSSSSSASGRGLDTRLVLTSQGAAAVDVAIVGADGRTGEARRVELPATTTTAADVDDLVRAAGGSGTPLALLLTPVGDGRVVAAVTARAQASGGADLIAASAVSPGPPAPSAVPVRIAAP